MADQYAGLQDASSEDFDIGNDNKQQIVAFADGFRDGWIPLSCAFFCKP